MRWQHQKQPNNIEVEPRDEVQPRQIKFPMKIIIYTKTGCPWCLGVLDLLRRNQIIFEERNVSENQEFFDEMIKKSGQSLTPTLDINGTILADSDQETVAKYLGI